jgi:hypothetical protein
MVQFEKNENLHMTADHCVSVRKQFQAESNKVIVGLRIRRQKIAIYLKI